MYLFLSPHFDDAVMSCGGVIHHLVQPETTVVVRTVMGQKPLPERMPDTALVRDLHTRWGSGAESVATRIQEDQQAVKHLGAEPQRMTVWPDCIYRQSRDGQPLYTANEALFGPVASEDSAGQLIPTIVLSPRDVVQTLYAPLGVGNHVDHQIVRNWALELKKQNPTLAVKLYEDYPYSENVNTVDRAMFFYQEQGIPLEAEVVELSEADVEAKLSAIACYQSQISTFWNDVEAMQQAVRRFLLRAGNGRPAERCWRVLP
jgi:LmbE family N-acetylglucosaminyl deacetylase